VILLYRFLCARKQCVYSGCSRGIKLLQQYWIVLSNSRAGTHACHLDNEKNQPGRHWKNLNENCSVSVAIEGGVEFYNQSVLWVSAERGMGKVLLNRAVSFKSSPVSAQRECYFRFPTIPWLGAFQYRVVCCELRSHTGHFVIYYALPTTNSYIYSWPLSLPHRMVT
jgi:hypothetical protein